MSKHNLMMTTLFFISLSFAFFSTSPDLSAPNFVLAIVLFVFFSILYSQVRVKINYGETELNYAINYGIAIAIYAGPMAAILYEISYHLLTHLLNRWRDPTYRKPLLFVFYNISIFSFANIMSYYLFTTLFPYFEPFPLGFWVLFAFLVLITNFLTDTFILAHFIFINKINSLREAFQFYSNWNILDLGKTALINGFLLIFLWEENWELLIGIFMLNYFVSQSIFPIIQNIRDKDDRDKFMKMAYQDALTGCYNRAYMDLKMQEIGEQGEAFGIVVADIDHFKNVNDSYNHAVGDEVLRHFTSFLNEYLFKEDLLFRSGGEEFTLFIRNHTFDEVYERLERVRHDLAKQVVHTDFNGQEVEIQYTASFGLYFKYFEDHSSIEKGYITADNLLFQSKHSGRNRITAETNTGNSSHD